MTAIDRKGQELKVGDVVLVPVRVIDIVAVGDESMLVGVTHITHGEEAKRYALPTFHGSQVEKTEL